MPATPSARPNGGSVGGPSSCPVWWANQLIASISVPNARRSAYGPSWPKPVTRSITSRGLMSSSVSGPSPPLLHDPRPEVLHDHVRVGDELAQQLLPLRPAEVQRDRALVAGDHLPPQAGPRAVPAVRAGRVAVRVLDLEHVGAHVAEQHRRDGRGVHRAHVEDLDPVERAGRSVVLRGRADRCLLFLHPLTPSSPVV